MIWPKIIEAIKEQGMPEIGPPNGAILHLTINKGYDFPRSFRLSHHDPYDKQGQDQEYFMLQVDMTTVWAIRQTHHRWVLYRVRFELKETSRTASDQPRYAHITIDKNKPPTKEELIYLKKYFTPSRYMDDSPGNSGDTYVLLDPNFQTLHYHLLWKASR